MNEHQHNGALLMISLEAAVPLWILEYRDQPWEKLSQLAADCGQFIAEHGDDLLFGGEHCGDAFNALAKSLAIMSFVPGGVTFNGRHWETKFALEEFMGAEEDITKGRPEMASEVFEQLAETMRVRVRSMP